MKPYRWNKRTKAKAISDNKAKIVKYKPVQLSTLKNYRLCLPLRMHPNTCMS